MSRGVRANGESLRRLRKFLGMTQETLAVAASCDVKTIRKAELGNWVDIATVGRIARALNVEIRNIVEDLGVGEAVENLNSRVAREWLAAFDARDPREIARLFCDDGLISLPGTPSLRGTGIFEGRREIAMQSELSFEMFLFEPYFSRNPLLAAQGSHVFVKTEPVRVTCNSTGSSTIASTVNIFEFKGGRIARLESYFDVSALDVLARPSSTNGP